MKTNRRAFLGTVGAGLLSSRLARAQGQASGSAPPIPRRKAKTTPLFKSPEGYPNAIAATQDGLWIAEQKSDNAHLVDWNGKVLKSVKTESKNTSGMAVGGGYIWMGANAAPQGIFQTDMTSKTVSHRQIPLGPPENGGGCHGLEYDDGKLWIAALRLGGILRVDPTTWTPEVLIRVSSDERPRLHDVAFDNDENIWVVTGNNSTSYAEGKAGLNKYDGKTGQLVMTIEFEPGSCDPHGLVWHDGRLVSCDAGIHPGWKGKESPHTAYIFAIDIV